MPYHAALCALSRCLMCLITLPYCMPYLHVLVGQVRHGSKAWKVRQIRQIRHTCLTCLTSMSYFHALLAQVRHDCIRHIRHIRQIRHKVCLSILKSDVLL